LKEKWERRPRGLDVDLQEEYRRADELLERLRKEEADVEKLSAA
jgi:hypothetical protein